MRSLSLVVTTLLILAVIAVGYGVYVTNGSQAEVDSQVADITPVEEKTTVDAQILSKPIVAEIENYRTFGTQPVQADPANLNRVNPFDNL